MTKITKFLILNRLKKKPQAVFLSYPKTLQVLSGVIPAEKLTAEELGADDRTKKKAAATFLSDLLNPKHSAGGVYATLA